MRKTTEQLAREVLAEARAVVESGWCQGQMRRRTGRVTYDYCLTGAVATACQQGREVYETACDLLWAAISPRPRKRGDLGSWNDLPFRTKEHVLALIDEVLA